MILKNCMYRTLLAAVALAFSSVAASAETITVCASGCDYTSINAAIDAATDGDVIQLAAETYFEGVEIDTLGKAITLQGVLDKAGEPASVLDGAGEHRVLTCQSGETSKTVFENLVVQNGKTSVGFDGGGMVNIYSSSPTLTNCTFTSNSADNDGGGMYNIDSSPTLTNCTFTSNSANYGSGGGMYNRSWSSPTLINCTFTSNSAADSGGGMYNHSYGSPTLTDCTLCGNDSGQIFGGFTNLGGNCLANSCDDVDGDGTPDECVSDRKATLLVPSEYARIEDAVEAAGYGDVVLVEAGVYFPSRTIDPGGKPITIRGAVDPTGQPATIIDGGGEIRVLECTSGESADTVFENLMIQNGYASSSAEEGGGGMHNTQSSPILSGGGMYNLSSSPTLTNCTFTSNSTPSGWSGGGMYNVYSSSPTLTNCTFTSNSTSNFGGGMSNNASSPVLVNCSFTGNSAYSGGGMDNTDSSSPTLTNCTFTSNSATKGNGGGMFNYDSSSPTLADCTFTSNSATKGNGGGMANFNSSPSLVSCAFLINISGTTSGGMYNSSSSPTLADCVFDGNTTFGWGGGMRNEYSSSPSLSNCVFKMNVAGYTGGGMWNTVDSYPTMTDCVLCANSLDQIHGPWEDDGSNCVATSCDDCEPPPLPCPGDLDQNGEVDASDLGLLIAAWNTDGSIVEGSDINGDGIVNAADLGLLIGAWGPCQ